MQTNLTNANDNMPLGYNVPFGHNSPMGGHNNPMGSPPSGHMPPTQNGAEHSIRYDRYRQATNRYSQATNIVSPTSGSTISVSEYSPVKMGVRIHLPKVPAPVTPQTPAQQTRKVNRQKTGRFPVYALLLLWALAVAAIARFSGSPRDATLLGTNLAIAGGALGVLSLALASLARKRRAKFSHSIGIASACVCLAGITWFYMQQSGIKIPPEFIALGVATASVILARIWKTPFLLHVSLLTMIGWSAYSFINTQVSELAWLFPALWSVQMFFALEFHFKRSIYLSIFTGLLWIGVNLFLLK